MSKYGRLLPLLSLIWWLLAENGWPFAAKVRVLPAEQGSGVITGTVSDEHGNPIADITVGAGTFDSIVNCQSGQFWAGTDSRGSYRLSVPAGIYLVFANSHGWRGSYVPEAYRDVNSWSRIAAATPVTVTAGQTQGQVDFHLSAGFTVSGRLVDGQGRRVRGAGGHIEDPTQNISFGCALGFGSNNSDGTFRVNVPGGRYDVGFNGATVRYSLVVALTGKNILPM